MKRIAAIAGVALLPMVLLVPAAHAEAHSFKNSSASKYSVRTWNNSTCVGKYYEDLRPGKTSKDWVSSYKIYSEFGSATYNGHTYKRARAVCYQTNVKSITVKAWGG